MDSGGFIKGQAMGNLTGPEDNFARLVWPSGFSYKEVHFKKFCPPVKTSCHPAENVNEIPEVHVDLFSIHVCIQQYDTSYQNFNALVR